MESSATFRRIVRNKSTGDFTWLPYVTTLLSTSLWTFYGLLKPKGLLVVTVNGAGAALEAVYVTLYLVYAPRETKVRSLHVHIYSSSIILIAWQRRSLPN
jgi:solute carrier family 50 protein (sugar transporter)